MAVLFKENLVKLAIDDKEIEDTLNMVDHLTQISSEASIEFYQTGLRDKKYVYLKNENGFEIIFFNVQESPVLEALDEIRHILLSKTINNKLK